jgi:hypothetical protein
MRPRSLRVRRLRWEPEGSAGSCSLVRYRRAVIGFGGGPGSGRWWGSAGFLEPVSEVFGVEDVVAEAMMGMRPSST